MGDWKTDIRSQLVDVRGADSSQRLALLNNELIRLSTTHALSRTTYTELQRNQQHWARAYCVGLSVRQAVITGRASAYLNDMWVANTPLDRVALVARHVPPRSQWPDGVQYVKGRLAERDLVRGTAMSTTSPLRTFFDVARFDGFAHALVVADWLVKHGGCTPDRLRTLVEIQPTFPGKVAARFAAQHVSTRPDSAPESYARGLLLAAGITNVQVNVWVLGGKYRVDLLINGWLVIEIDGWIKYDGETYGKTDEQLMKEKQRQNEIENDRFKVLRFSPRYLEEHPDKFIATVRKWLAKGY